MSILKRLFGGGGESGGRPQRDAVEYNGYRIRPDPFKADGQYQTAGIIEKDFPDGAREHRFIRAERHASADEAADFAVTKGKQIIDERGERIFDTK
jgi:hypothetical protein